MKNNEYKKYFDQVSPEQNLIQQTKKKMYDELNNTSAPLYKYTKTSFIRYGALAACAVIAAVTVAVVPKPVETDVEEMNNPNNQADISFMDTESTSVTEQSVTTHNSMTTSNDNVSGTDIEKEPVYPGIVTSVPVFSSNGNNSNNTQSQIHLPVTTAKTTYSHDVTKQTVHNTTSNKSETECSPPIITGEVLYTTPAVNMPVPDYEHQVTMPCLTTATSNTVNSNSQVNPDYRPGAPADGDVPPSGGNDSVGNDTVYYITKVETDGYNGEVIVNIENEYYNHHYSNPQTVSVDDVNNYFGKDICPQVLREQYSDLLIKTDEYAGMGDGTSMIFGECTGLYVTDSKFVIMSVAKQPDTLPYEYRVEPPNPIATAINGNEYVIVTLSRYPDTFFCSYQKDGVYYSVCFKGYSITDVVNLLLSF